MVVIPRRPHRGGPPLTADQFAALGDVALHRVVTPAAYRVLKNLGLVEQKLGGWRLTHEGQIRLTFKGAR
jgi:hypothetical protein